jgi:hypothetical protein
MLDDVRRWHDAHIGYLPQTQNTFPAADGYVYQELANIAQAVAGLGHAPYHYLEHLLFLEKGADLNALQQCGRRPTYIAWFNPMLFGRGQVYLDPQLGLLDLTLNLRTNNTFDPRKALPQFLCLAAQDPQVLAVDAHDDAVLYSRYLSNDLFQIGLHLSRESWVATNHPLNGGYRRIIVSPGVEADPNLSGFDIAHLI